MRLLFPLLLHCCTQAFAISHNRLLWAIDNLASCSAWFLIFAQILSLILGLMLSLLGSIDQTFLTFRLKVCHSALLLTLSAIALSKWQVLLGKK